MKRGSLTNRRIQGKYGSQGLKHDILHSQILAAGVSVPISAMPVVTERVPPHLNGAIQRFICENKSEQIEHGAYAFFAGCERQIGIPQHAVYCAVEIRALDSPKSLLKLSFGKSLNQKFRLSKQLHVVAANRLGRVCDLHIPIPRVPLRSFRRNVPLKHEGNELVEGVLAYINALIFFHVGSISEARLLRLGRDLSIGRRGQGSSGRRRGMWRRSRTARRGAKRAPMLAIGDRNAQSADTAATSADTRRLLGFAARDGKRTVARWARDTSGTLLAACQGAAGRSSGGAGDQVADFAEGGVGAQADAGPRQAHPEAAAAALYGAGEGAIVDDFAADGSEAADPLERVPTQENAAAGGSRGARVWVGNPARRIEFQEKEKERGD